MAAHDVSEASRIAVSTGGRSHRELVRKVWSRLFSISTFLLGFRLFGAGAGFVVQLLLARHLQPEQLGVYFAATSMSVIVGVLAAHGFPSIATRFVSRYRRPGAGPLLQAFVRNAQRDMWVLAIAAGVIVSAGAVAWPGFTAETKIVLVIAAVMIPFVGCFRLYGSFATATRAFALAYLPDVCLKPAVVLALLGLVLLAWGDVTLITAIVVLAGATVALAVIQAALLARGFPVPISPLGRDERRSVSRRLTPKWRREAHAVLLVAVIAQFFPDLSILLSTPVLSAAEIAGLGIALKLGFLVGFFVSVTQNIATPDIADALNKRGEGRRRIAPIGPSATAVTLLALMFCVLWGEPVLRIFGPHYAQAHAALVLMVAAQVVQAVFGPANAVLTILGAKRANLLSAAFAGAVLAVSTVSLGALFGLNGAAAGVLIATLSWCGASALALQRTAGLRVDVFAGWFPSQEAIRAEAPAH